MLKYSFQFLCWASIALSILSLGTVFLNIGYGARSIVGAGIWAVAAFILSVPSSCSYKLHQNDDLKKLQTLSKKSYKLALTAIAACILVYLLNQNISSIVYTAMKTPQASTHKTSNSKVAPH